MTPAPSTTSVPLEAASPSVLVVDDSSVELLLTQTIIENHLHWQVQTARNGAEALVQMHRQPPSVVVTDLVMPEMDGLALVQAIRRDHPLVPVVLMTAFGNEELALKALKAGAASYVPKRTLDRDLPETLEHVLEATRAESGYRRLLGCLRHVEHEFILDNDPSLVPPLVAQLIEPLPLLDLCDANTQIRIGIALEEALLNALYHGNLEVSSTLRQDDSGAYYELAERRRVQEPYRNRRLYVRARVSRTEAIYEVRDEGPGFNPDSIPDPMDPANLDKASGRGVFLIRTFMDEVRYNERGNQITIVKRKPILPL
jgi:CheY-like chemotaxis protein/anti-sigma regulatory factor (Ser/Thr protein kinase)